MPEFLLTRLISQRMYSGEKRMSLKFPGAAPFVLRTRRATLLTGWQGLSSLPVKHVFFSCKDADLKEHCWSVVAYVALVELAQPEFVHPGPCCCWSFQLPSFISLFHFILFMFFSNFRIWGGRGEHAKRCIKFISVQGCSLSAPDRGTCGT